MDIRGDGAGCLSRVRRDHWFLISIICLGASLRLIGLGSVFPTSDHAELATRIVTHDPYFWIVKD